MKKIFKSDRQLSDEELYPALDKGVLLKGIKRAAEFFQCSTRTIQELVNNGTIPSYMLGKNRYFYSNEIDEALRDRSKEKEANPDQSESL